MDLPDAYVIHNVAKGYKRLLHAPLDLNPRLSLPKTRISIKQALPEVQSQFLRYHSEIQAGVLEASVWWIGIVDQHAERTGDRAAALRSAFGERPAGPAAHGMVVSTIRRNWLAICELNAAVPEAQRTPPQDFLLGWAAEVNSKNVVVVLTAMPYWPIGLDEHGNWC
jgi:hypothetical protein